MDILLSGLNWNEIRKRNIRQKISQFVRASYSLIGTFMLYMVISLYLNNESPITCVLTESMEPGFNRGDILLIRPQLYKVGDIAVYQVYENSIPIVHRIIKKVGDKILTKGDNNRVDDVGLYRPGKQFLEPNEIRAGVFGHISFFGIFSVWVLSVPGLKILIMIYTAYSVFSSRGGDLSGDFIHY